MPPAALTRASRFLQIVSRLSAFSLAIGTMRERYKKEMAERRRLHNLVQELRGNIRVYARVRPPLHTELEAGAPVVASFPAEGEVRMVNNKRQAKAWEFDAVFPPSADNDAVFAATEPLIVSVMDGYNVCVFAYGQTGR